MEHYDYYSPSFISRRRRRGRSSPWRCGRRRSCPCRTPARPHSRCPGHSRPACHLLRTRASNEGSSVIVNFSRRFAASSTRATHLALGAGGGGGAARPVVICGAAAGGRVRRAAVHRAVARRAVVVAAVQIARALSVIVAVTLAWKYYYYYLSSLLEKHLHEKSSSPGPDHTGWRLSSRTSHCLLGCRRPLVLWWLWL